MVNLGFTDFILLLFIVIGKAEECLEGGYNINTFLPPSGQDAHFIIPNKEKQYALSPRLVVKCYGRIISWSALTAVTNQDFPMDKVYTIELTVWRPRKGKRYNLIGQDHFSFSSKEVKENMFDINNKNGSLPPNVVFFQLTHVKPYIVISVQPDDIIGWNVPSTEDKYSSPLSIVSFKTKVNPASRPLKIIQVTDEAMDSYCSYIYCNGDSEMIDAHPYVSFEYELEDERSGFYIASSTDKCDLPKQPCEDNYDFEIEAHLEDSSIINELATNSLIGIICASLSAAFVVVVCICTINYIYFHIKHNNRKNGIVPVAGGILDPISETVPKFPISNTKINNEPTRSSLINVGAKFSIMQDSKPQLKKVSLVAAPSTMTAEKRLSSRSPKFDVPDEEVESPSKCLPTAPKEERVIFYGTSKVSPQDITMHSAGYIEHSPCVIQDVPKATSLPAVKNGNLNVASEVATYGGETPAYDQSKNVSFDNRNKEGAFSPTNARRSGATSESFRKCAGAGKEDPDIVQSHTEFSESVASATKYRAVSSMTESGMVDGGALPDDGKEERIMTNIDLGEKKDVKDADISDEGEVEKKHSTFFDIVTRPDGKFPTAPIKPYYSSGTVPKRDLVLDSDVEMDSDHSLTRKSV